jgi:hypothetical protein
MHLEMRASTHSSLSVCSLQVAAVLRSAVASARRVVEAAAVAVSEPTDLCIVASCAPILLACKLRPSAMYIVSFYARGCGVRGDD